MTATIKLIHRQLKKWYYYQELKEVSAAALAIFAIWFIYSYGKTIVQWLLTEEGHLYSMFFMAGLVLAIVVKLYYRVMVIKYHEKDTNIALFKELNKN